MKQYDVVLFDLDGTLTDPGEGITNSVAYALRKFGVPVPERRELYKFIGPPLSESFAEYYGFTGDQISQAITWYREYFSTAGINENLLYDGVEEMLCRLRDAGKILLVATSKPERFARQILETFGLAEYFTCIAGASFDGTRSAKADVIAYALKSAGIEAGRSAVMVGDRKYDMTGAAENGLDGIGVLSGYGSRQELEDAGALYIADHISEIADLLLL